MATPPFWLEHLITYKKGEETPMYKSEALPVQDQVELKEGATYPEGITSIFEIQFKVAAPIKGLVCQRKVYKGKLRVNVEDTPMGDFEPSEESKNYKFKEETSPSGFIVRGGFTTTLDFINADKKVIYHIKYPFQIVKK